MIIKPLLELNVCVCVWISIINVEVGHETGICSFSQHLCRSVLNPEG